MLCDLVAQSASGQAARRAEVQAWARYEYRTEPVVRLTTTPSMPTESLPTETRPAETPAEPTPAPEAPGAYRIPDDLLSGVDDAIDRLESPPSKLIEAEGFETLDED